MPEFEDLGQVLGEDGRTMVDHPDRFKAADAWRAEHAPARIKRIQPPATDDSDKTDTGKEGASEPRLDVEQFDVEVGDFDGWVVKKAERALKIAIGMYDEACAKRDPIAIMNATRNLSEIARRTKTIREDFAGLQSKARETININRAVDVVGKPMQALVKAMTGMGARLAARANPQDAALAQKVIDDEVDRIFAMVSEVLTALGGAEDNQAAAA